jgi:hypothetical protein
MLQCHAFLLIGVIFFIFFSSSLDSYLDGLLAAAKAPSAGSTSVGAAGGAVPAAATEAVLGNPIEAVFQRHARRTLLSYQEYFGELRAGHVREQQELRVTLQTRIDAEAGKVSVEAAVVRAQLDGDDLLPADAPVLARSPSEERAQATIRALTLEFEDKQASLQQKYDKSVQLVVSAFDQLRVCFA